MASDALTRAAHAHAAHSPADETPLRLLALDIDGTLTNSAKQIMPFTRKEIARVVETGVHPVIVTARAIDASLIIERKLGVPTSHIAFGGGSVRLREGGRLTVLEEHPFDSSAVELMLDAVQGSDVHVGLYTATEWHVSDMGFWGLREARNTSIWPDTVGDGTRPRAPADPVLKLMFRGDREALAPIKAVIDRELPSVFAHLSARVLEVTTSRKHVALRSLSERLGIAPREVIAFGDTEADAPMLEEAGVGVLMGNADPALQIAPHVERTLSNDEEGVGLSLRKHFPTEAPFEI
ncbi:HAD hydrolase family protein [Leucobacter sp. USCH14]|uniref:HAD hydrolase family protein n=1 Tax=Leucobacter sp. USCH14 TaxID=3024838 RepID=UPI0030B7CF96